MRKCGSEILHAISVLVIVCALVLGIFLHILLFEAVLLRLNMNDFGKFYYAAQYFVSGLNMYEPSPATYIPVGSQEFRVFLNLNPPHFHFLVLPFVALKPEHAAAMWLGANMVALLWSGKITTAVLRIPLNPLRILAAVSALLWSAPLWALTVTGQLSGLLALVTTMVWRDLAKGRHVRSAACLGLAVSVKPFVGLLLLPMFVRGGPRVLLPFALSVAGVFAAGLSVFGFQQYANWIDALEAVDWAWPAMNASVAGVVARGLSISPYYTPLIDASNLVRPITLILSVGLLGTGVVRAMRHLGRKEDGDVHTAAALLLLSAGLAFPLGWTYYWFIAAPPLAAVVRERVLGRKYSKATVLLFGVFCIGLFIPLPLVTVLQPSGLATVTLGSVYFWSLLSLWLALMVGRARGLSSPWTHTR